MGPPGSWHLVNILVHVLGMGSVPHCLAPKSRGASRSVKTNENERNFAVIVLPVCLKVAMLGGLFGRAVILHSR